MKVFFPDPDQRIDVALAQSIPGLSRSGAQKLLEQGAVTLDGMVVKKNARTIPEKPYQVELPPAQEISLSPQDIPLDIVWEDDDLLVLNKPKGLVVHPAPGHWEGTLVNGLLFHCKDSLSGINSRT